MIITEGEQVDTTLSFIVSRLNAEHEIPREQRVERVAEQFLGLQFGASLDVTLDQEQLARNNVKNILSIIETATASPFIIP